MANISTYAADKLLDALLRDTAYTSTTTYVALFTTDPTMPAGTGGVEVSGGSYVREQLNTLLAAAASGSSSNSSAVNWPTASAAWGTITGVGIYDAVTAGNLLAAGPLTANKTVGSGDTFSLPISDLTVALS
jgi:hypothetical protein